MKKNTISVLGLELEHKSSKESLREGIGYLQTEGISTIDLIGRQTVLNLQDNADLKAALEVFDMVLPGTEELLVSGGIEDARTARRDCGRSFLEMYLQYMKKNKKRVFVLNESREGTDSVIALLEKKYKGLNVVGTYALSEEVAAEEKVVNEINSLIPDCVLCAMESPLQEAFLIRNYALLNTRVWLGCGDLLQKMCEEDNVIQRIRNFFQKKIFEHQTERK